jgi:hypothetical protein
MHHLLIADIVGAVIIAATLAAGLIDATPGPNAAPAPPARISFINFIPPQP